MSGRRYAVIAGGGTAGHVFVATAVAGALVELGVPRDEIELVGARRAADATLAGGEGYAITLLPGRGIRRTLDPGALVANLGASLGLLVAFARALALLARRRPRVVVSVGGFVAVPVGLAAALLGVPLVLVNTDALAGAAHRALRRFAAASAVAFASTGLPHAVVTGAPVRPELARVERSAEGRRSARAQLGLPPERPTVGVTGGSLGAGTLNVATLELAAALRERSGLSLYHVCGPRNFEALREARRSSGAPEEGDASGLFYTVVPFEEHMASFYAACDVVVCRAGALTVAELALVGAPAILVPLPGAPGDHQSANAAALLDAGAAVVVRDEECDGRRLGELLDALLGDPARLEAMAAAASAIGRPGAARAVGALVQAHAR